MYALVNITMLGTSAGVIGSAIYDSSGATAFAVMQDKTAYFAGIIGAQSGVSAIGGMTVYQTSGGNTVFSVDGAGNVVTEGGVTVAGGQINFPITQVPSANVNTLDDYKEGTWTPSVVSGAGTITTVGTVSGTYTKIGRLVTLTFDVIITDNGTGSAAIHITGYPYTPPVYVAGSGTELAVTGKQLKIEKHVTEQILVVKNYDNTYPAANGSRMVGCVTFPNTN